jgi:hypothetical protein
MDLAKINILIMGDFAIYNNQNKNYLPLIKI